MGNYRFKLSDMIPNAWFHKLIKYKNSKTKNQNSMQNPKKKNHAKIKSPTYYSSSSVGAAPASPQPHHQRKSYHIARDLPPIPDNNLDSQHSDSPRKSLRKRSSIKKNRRSIRSTSPRLHSSASVSADYSCRASLEDSQNCPPIERCYSDDDFSVFPEMRSEIGDKPFHQMVSSCHCRAQSDIPIGMTVSQNSKFENFDPLSLFELKPIITKTNKVVEVDKEVSQTSQNSKFENFDPLSLFELKPIITKTNKVVEVDKEVSQTSQNSKFENFDPLSLFELKPIITKTNKVKEVDKEVTQTRMVSARKDENISHFSSKEQKTIYSVKKLAFNNNSTGVKLKTDSPRIANKRLLQAHHRKSVSSGGARRSLESIAVVKTSQDPHKDFKDSMAEMITENDIKTSKDLEDLLACYLSLNSDKYHGLIIGAFKQIWFEIIDK